MNKSTEFENKEFASAAVAQDARRLLALAGRAAARIDIESCRLLATLNLVGRIVVSPFVRTAQIQSSDNGVVIRLGRQFLVEMIQDPISLLWIIHHEIGHMLLGHIDAEWQILQGLPKDTYQRACHGLAVDIAVNRFLCDVWKGVTPGVDKRCHGKGIIDGLLATPETIIGHRWNPGTALSSPEILRQFSIRAHDERISVDQQVLRAIATFYVDVWERQRVHADEIEKSLIVLLRPWREEFKTREQQDIVVLNRESPMLQMDIVHVLPERWKRLLTTAYRDKKNDFFRGDYGDILQQLETENRIEPKLVRRIASILARKLAPLLQQHALGVLQSEDYRTPVPLRIGRRETFLLASGFPPALFPGLAAESLPPLVAMVDVSGSTFMFWASCIEALRLVMNHRPLRAFQFSNKVVPLDLSKLKSGVCTTGGTDFDCCVQFALDRLDRKMCPIFLITDGYAELQKDLMMEAARRGLTFEILVLDEYGMKHAHLHDHLRQMFGPCLAGPDGVIVLSGGDNVEVSASEM